MEFIDYKEFEKLKKENEVLRKLNHFKVEMEFIDYKEFEKLKKENEVLRKWMREIEEQGCEVGGNNFHFEMVQQCWNELRQLDKDKG